MQNKMTNEEREFLYGAIDHYRLLPESHRQVLKSLIEIQINGKVIANAKRLSKFCGSTIDAFYLKIHNLKKKNFIYKKKGDKITIYLNWEAIEEIKKHRQNQLDALMQSRKSVEIDSELVKKIRELFKTDCQEGERPNAA